LIVPCQESTHQRCSGQNKFIPHFIDQSTSKQLDESSPNGKPVIRTIHALCLEVVGIDLRILLSHERDAMIYDILCAHEKLSQKYRDHKTAEQALRDHEAKHQIDYNYGRLSNYGS
jgi:hypothetical protein